GTDVYLFSSVQKNIRGKVFDIVTMQEPSLSAPPRELGFTTDLGPHWEPWMYIRELWSNMKDEGGSCAMGHGGPFVEGETRIVCVGPRIEQAFQDRGSFILPEMKPLASTEFADV